MSGPADFMTLAGVRPKKGIDPVNRSHVGYNIEFIDGSVMTTDIINFEVFPGVNMLFLFSEDEDQHIESAFSMSTIKSIEARYA